MSNINPSSNPRVTTNPLYQQSGTTAVPTNQQVTTQPAGTPSSASTQASTAAASTTASDQAAQQVSNFQKELIKTFGKDVGEAAFASITTYAKQGKDLTFDVIKGAVLDAAKNAKEAINENTLSESLPGDMVESTLYDALDSKVADAAYALLQKAASSKGGFSNLVNADFQTAIQTATQNLKDKQVSFTAPSKSEIEALSLNLHNLMAMSLANALEEVDIPYNPYQYLINANLLLSKLAAIMSKFVENQAELKVMESYLESVELREIIKDKTIRDRITQDLDKDKNEQTSVHTTNLKNPGKFV